MNRIIYKKPDNSVAVIIPAQEVLDAVGLASIANKDVPEGLPYWFADETEIPSDRSARHLWVMDESAGDPDGYGGIGKTFSPEEIQTLRETGVV
jgi:hypothetical protein